MRILVAAGPGERRVAAWDGMLIDYAIERPGAPDGVGDLHRGRVIARVSAMAGLFVALAGAEGFLPDSAAPDSLREGDSVGVRIARAAQGGKGPRLTARLAPDEAAIVVAGPPGLLRRGPGAIARMAALHPAAPVVVDSAAVVAELKPALGARVRHGDAFDDAVEAEIDALSGPVVDLPTGARLSVHPTPALTAIDVDLRRATAERGAKATVQDEANRALLPALARQIRLRNLGGAILVDLGGLSVKRRAVLGPPLTRALAGDPLHPSFLGFTALGLAEILRPRVHPPLHELLAGPHAAGLAALREAARRVAARPATALALRAVPAILDALRADPVALADLAHAAGRPLMLRSNLTQAEPPWSLEELP